MPHRPDPRDDHQHESDRRDAQAALLTIDRQRRRVLDEIDMPRWYWWGLGLAWIVLGLSSDLAPAWLTVALMVVVGAVHAAVSHHVLSGRHRSRQLSVRQDLVDRDVPAFVITFLLGLVAVTVAAALLVAADGARHPSTIASVGVAVALVLGGPQLMAAMRRRAIRKAEAA